MQVRHHVVSPTLGNGCFEVRPFSLFIEETSPVPANWLSPNSVSSSCSLPTVLPNILAGCWGFFRRVLVRQATGAGRTLPTSWRHLCVMPDGAIVVRQASKSNGPAGRLSSAVGAVDELPRTA